MADEEIKHTNETYTITVGSPLLRPGITISCEVSSKYLVPTTAKLMAMVREINSGG